MKDYRTYSYWLDSCGDDLAPRPALPGTVDADIAILGAGFSGLWTAYYLLKRQPSLKIAIVEKDIAGFGASGRNGGWCSALFALRLTTIARRFGKDAAVRMRRAMLDTVDEVGRVAAAEGLDIDYARGGSLVVARSPQFLPWVEGVVTSNAALGLGDEFELLDAAKTAERVRIAGAVGSVYSRDTAAVHPGKLARGLAHIVERLGATIYEQTEVTGFATGSHPALHTPRGHVRAKTIVLCGEAYLSQVKQTRRAILPAYSSITLTEPLPESAWAEIGWRERECVESSQYLTNYLSKTADGRILFGGEGAHYRFGSRLRDEDDIPGPTREKLQRDAREWFPALKDVRFTHSWGGVYGMARDQWPTMKFDPVTGVAATHGYTGVGVAASNLGGRVLADLITGVESEVSTLPVVGHTSRRWEPEPLRFIGARFVQRQMGKLEEKVARTGKTPGGNSLAERLLRQ